MDTETQRRINRQQKLDKLKKLHKLGIGVKDREREKTRSPENIFEHGSPMTLYLVLDEKPDSSPLDNLKNEFIKLKLSKGMPVQKLLNLASNKLGKIFSSNFFSTKLFFLCL